MSNKRDQMPLVTGFIDDMREAFGKDVIDQAIAKGIEQGWGRAHGFYASENGHEIGHLPPKPKGEITGGQWVRLSKLIEQDQHIKPRGAGPSRQNHIRST